MVLVDVYIPSIDDTFDFMLDENTMIDKIIVEMTEMISKKVNSDNVLGSPFNLYSMDEKMVLDEYKTLKLCGIKNGSKLILV